MTASCPPASHFWCSLDLPSVLQVLYPLRILLYPPVVHTWVPSFSSLSTQFGGQLGAFLIGLSCILAMSWWSPKTTHWGNRDLLMWAVPRLPSSPSGAWKPSPLPRSRPGPFLYSWPRSLLLLLGFCPSARHLFYCMVSLSFLYWLFSPCSYFLFFFFLFFGHAVWHAGS